MLKVQNEKLQQNITDLEISREKQLEQLANTFHVIMNENKAKLKKNIELQRKKNDALTKSIQRKEKNIKNLKTLFKILKDRNILTKDDTFKLSNEFGELLIPILENEKKNKDKSSKGRRYSDEVKRFAVTMHYHSPKAYEYCRTIFKLPHASAIRNWTSAVDTGPGFQLQILRALKDLNNDEKDCCLIFDGMAIREQLLWSEKEHKYIGFCDYGNSINLENKDTEATEALVFLLVSLKGIWKWPIAYFFKHSMSAMTLAELIKTALLLTAEEGLRIRAVIADGDINNCTAFKLLGANIFHKNNENIQNFFPHVTMKHNVRVLLDPCHMLKLARNAIADCKEFKIENGDLIKWQHITKLHSIQNQLTFKLKNRLNSQCVYWKQNKMKVKYAAHTLSSSVANAIQFLKEENFDEFKDSNGTIQFITIIDKMFDFLNSRNPFGKGYKKPIFESNIPYLRNMVKEYITYLFSLQDKEGKPLYNTGRKTFIYGFAISAKSVLDVAEDLFKENKSYKYLLTYNFSQDHVETFFSKIRSHGHNNNPNVFQFKNAMRQLLLRNDIRHSTNANCIKLDTDLSDSIFEFRWKKRKQSILNDFNNNYESDDEYIHSGAISLPSSMKKLNEYIMYYLSGYIVKKINTDCYTCALQLRSLNNEHNYANSYVRYPTFAKFLDFSNNGGLIKPSNSVYKICIETEKQLNIVTDGYSELSVQRLDYIVINRVKNNLALDSSIFPSLECDNVGILDMPHKIRLIIAISSRYVKVRLHTYSKFYLQEVLKPIRKRHQLTKQILFYRE